MRNGGRAQPETVMEKGKLINHLLRAGNFILAEELMLLNCGVGEDS